MYSREDILNVTEVKKMPEGAFVKGLVLLKECKKKTAKNGSSYMEGMLELGGALAYKAWGNSSAFSKLDLEDYSNTVVNICAKVNLYNGVMSIILDDVFAVDLSGSEISEDDFLGGGYNGDEYFAALKKVLGSFVDEDTMSIFNIIVKDVEKRFKVEYAAKGMHDNCKGGLVAHTYKVLYICKILKLYPNILQFEGNMNLIALGAVLHDIGKVFEYHNGSIIGNGLVVSHHTFGVEMLFKYKNMIVEKKGEEFFYRLCAIIEQHHGEYEERPRTIEAYLIHQIDKIESSLQLLNQSLEGFEKGNQLVIDSFKLS